jgi:hypothetical protein
MAHTQGADYYTRRQDELLSNFDRESGRWQPLLAGRYGSLEAAAMLGNARARFEALIPELPYIGGDENHLTGALVDSARCLALFLAMRHRNHTAADTGRILYDAVRARAGEPRPQIPPAECLSREALMARRRRRAARSQQKRHPEDYVYHFVEGDGTTFDFGYDFYECATDKLYRAHGAHEFTPYYCFLDYPKAELDGLGLSRTMTLAEGHRLCNHRFRAGGQATRTWPPAYGLPLG